MHAQLHAEAVYIVKDDTKYKKAIIALFLGSFVTFASLYSAQPLIPIFSAEFHIIPADASLSVSFATFTLAFFMLIMSSVSDAKGRKAIMAASLVGTSTLGIVASFVSDFHWLLVVRALQGITLAGFPAIAMTYINEEFHPKITGAVIGVYIAGSSIGGLAGRIIVGSVSDFFSWHAALAVLGIISLMVSVWFWFNLPDSHNFHPRHLSTKKLSAFFQRNIHNVVLIALCVIGFICMGSFVTLYNFIGYPLVSPPFNLSHTLAGCIFIVYLVGTFSSAFMGKMADKIGHKKALLVSMLIFISGDILTLAETLPFKILGIAIFTFGFFAAHAVASGWVARSVAFNRALASSSYLLFYYVGSSIMGTTGGHFLLRYGWNGVVFFIATALSIGTLISVFLLLRKSPFH